MVSQKRNGKTESPSLPPFWEKAFLFFTFVLLPIATGFFLICQSIDRQMVERRELVRKSLEFRANEYAKSFAPEQVLRKIVHGWAKKGTPSFQKFLFSLEKAWPETFKIIAWDRDGIIIPLQGPVLSGKKMWQNIIRRFFLPVIPVAFQASQIASDPDLKSLQGFLGKKVPFEYLLSLRNACLDSVWLEKPCLFFQFTAPPQGAIAGALVLVLHHSFPANFWERAALTMGIREFKDGETCAVAVDIANPGRGFSQKGFFFDRHFRADLLRSYSLRADELFPVDRWLAMEVKGSPSPAQRIFLLADFSQALREAAGKKNQARCLVLLLILLFFHLFKKEFQICRADAPEEPNHPDVLPVSVSAAGMSFRWRMSGLFSLALFLPTIGFIFLGIHVVQTEKEKCRKQATEQMRSFCSLLTSRFNAFPATYGRSIHKSLLQVKSRVAAPIPCLPWIHALVQRGTFSSYYLSDTTGRVATFFDPQRGPKGAQSLRFAVQKGFADTHAQFKKQTSPATSSIPEKGGSSVVPSGHSSVQKNVLGKPLRSKNSTETYSGQEDVFQAGELRLFRMGSAETYIMAFDILFRGEYRLLLLEINPEAMERSFATSELRRQNLAKQEKLSDYSCIRWEFLSRNGVLPGGSILSTALRHSPDFRGFEQNQRLEGEMVIQDSPVFFTVPDFSTFKVIRPIILFPQKPWVDRLSYRKNQIFLAIGISLGISLLLGLVLATGLLKPIKTLDSAVREIRDGNLRLRLPDLGNNELGRLNQSFNDMASGLEERQRMRTFVSSSVLEAVSDENSGTRNRGEIRTVAVLFSHIKDFTSLSAIASPQEIFAVLNEFLAGAEQCIRAFGGEVDKFIGDAVMATFLRSEREMAAVKAALALHDFVNEWNRERQTNGLWTIAIGIGIHSGPVMMGDLGSSRRKDLTVIGDTVNLAARLESVSGAGRKTHIILSESIFLAVKSLISVEELSVTQVKGKTEPVRMFELTGVIEEC